MTKYAIDMAVLDASRTIGEKRVPTSLRFKFIAAGEAAWEYLENFRIIMSSVASTNRCRAVLHPDRDQYDVTVVGMQEDVEWCQMLWMQIFLEFVSRVNPKWDHAQSIGENVARLKEAGRQWKTIWAIAKDAAPEIDNLDEYDPKGASYLMRDYKRFLKDHPDRQQVGTQRFEAYRYSFVRAFAWTVASRLEQMRNDSQEETTGSGSELALQDVGARVDEEFYTLFPSQRPRTEEELAEIRRRVEEREREDYRKDQEFLASLSPQAREKVLRERAEEALRRSRADDRYWRRQQERAERLHDDAGSQAGRAAASQVNLARGAAQVDVNQRAEIEG
jgi:hypothetical protein